MVGWVARSKNGLEIQSMRFPRHAPTPHLIQPVDFCTAALVNQILDRTDTPDVRLSIALQTLTLGKLSANLKATKIYVFTRKKILSIDTQPPNIRRERIDREEEGPVRPAIYREHRNYEGSSNRNQHFF